MEHTPHHAPDAHTEGASASPADPAAIAGFWDERYSDLTQLWSGQPNAALVTEVSDIPAGRVLDVGCGEGADALWLAERGWTVTALDVSTVAIKRGAAEAELRGVTVHWLHSGLVEADLPEKSFDLVSAQYPALLRTEHSVAEHALLAAVAVGGTLLVVHHPTPTTEEASGHGFDPEMYVSPGRIAALLGEDWQVQVSETRPRHVATGGGARHTTDVILRAQRLR